MATAFAASLTLPTSISPFPFNSNPLPFRSNTILFPRSPSIVSPPIAIAFARPKSGRRGSNSAITIDSDIDEDDDDGEEFVAFKDMRRWELNKPRGFGEGKVYDTAVEEKLLEEIERERAALLAAEKKKAKLGSNKKQETQQPPQKEIAPTGPCVRLGNLPKKKNIHRDLQAAFKGFRGIVNISPAVNGNRKTRDPICKGFAFVEFVSEEAAVRFVSMFSKQDILFGKVQKKISFDIINAEQLVNNTRTSAQPKVTDAGIEKQEEFIGLSTVDEAVKDPMVIMDDAAASLSDSEGIELSVGHLNIPPLCGNGNGSDADDLSSDDLELSFQNQRKQIASKKVVKKKSTKTARPSLPSSIARLKIKERSVLTGVFTKYGGKAASLQISNQATNENEDVL